MATILVVEDDEEIAGLLKFNLKKQGYSVLIAEEGYRAIEIARESIPDLILLDLMLPGIDGYEVCRILRSSESLQHIPLIMLTAKSEEFDIVLGLEMGADDYVTKPFSVRELLSRIKAHLRRNERNAMPEKSSDRHKLSGELNSGEIILKTEEHKVFVRNKPVNLTNKEFELLKLLMENEGKVLKRNYLLERIWDFNTEVDTRTVDVHIRYLRQKIEEDAANPKFIETVRGVGYCFCRQERENNKE